MAPTGVQGVTMSSDSFPVMPNKYLILMDKTLLSGAIQKQIKTVEKGMIPFIFHIVTQ